jgi:hypothetical protein
LADLWLTFAQILIATSHGFDAACSFNMPILEVKWYAPIGVQNPWTVAVSMHNARKPNQPMMAAYYGVAQQQQQQNADIPLKRQRQTIL